MTGNWRVLLVGLALSGVTACTQVQDPWVSGSQYAQERQRTAEQSRELRQRVWTVQTDR
jgi:hypothetical protein